MSIFGVNKNEGSLYEGVHYIEVQSKLIERVIEGKVHINEFPELFEPLENSFVLLKNENTIILTKVNDEHLIYFVERSAYYIEGRNTEQCMILDALLDPNIPLVTITGVAGTGKTLLALAAAIEQRSLYHKILVSRPIMPMGKDIGFLPGILEEKVKPYMAPIFDNLGTIKKSAGNDKMKAVKLINDMNELEKIVVEPLTYIRGRNLDDTFLIVDEAQNLTKSEIKTIITRAGKGTKIVITGDVEQIDNPSLNSTSNGVSYLIDRMKGQKLFSYVNLIESERSPLAKLAGELL